MHSLIHLVNRVSDSWFQIAALNSLQLLVLFVFLWIVTALLRKKSSLFLYSVWLLFLLKAILVPVFRLPFFQRVAVPVMQFSAIVSQSSEVVARPAATVSFPLSYQSVLLIGWSLGLIVLIILYLRNERHFFASLRDAAPFRPGNLAGLLAQLAVGKPVVLRISARVPAPFTRGFRRPVIYLPESARDWSTIQLNHVIAHELAHIKRRDLLMITIQNIISVLYFFHPLVWLANRQINFQREKICDDITIAVLQEEPARYGRTLMENLESFLLQRRMPLIANGLFFSKKTIIRRFEYLLQRGKETAMKLKPFQIIALAVLSILVVITACSNSSDETPVSATPAVEESRGLPETEFIPYDSPPQPVGGYGAVAERLKKYNPGPVEGTAIIKTFIDENGKVAKLSILRSCGSQHEDQIAYEVIKNTSFIPAQQRDQEIGVWITIPVVFEK